MSSEVELPVASVEKLREAVEIVRDSLLTEVTIATDPIAPKAVFKLLVFRESLSWRIYEIANSAVEALDRGELLSSMILCRSLQETVALNFHLLREVEKCANAGDVSTLDASAMQMLLGSREIDARYQSLNILTAVDRLDRAFPSYRNLYNGLSEYCHPNFAGVANCFAHH